jgi:hypothetical protein
VSDYSFAVMASRGSPHHATLYSAIIREISAKGKESRFVKKERGRFAVR